MALIILYLLLHSSFAFCNTFNEFKSEISIPPKANRIIVSDVAFIKLGTYRGFTDDGAEYQKSFFFPRYMSTPWGESRAICNSYGLEFATFETLNETRALLNMADNYRNYTLPVLEFYIDGTTLSSKSTTDWYWTNTGVKISFPIPWYTSQPNFSGNIQFCLSIFKENASKFFGFNDIECQAVPRSFICQRIELYIPKAADT